MQAAKRKNKFAYLLNSSVGIRESSLCRMKCDLAKKKFGDKAASVLFPCTDIIRAEVAILLPQEIIQRYDTFALLHVILFPWLPPFPSSPLYFVLFQS